MELNIAILQILVVNFLNDCCVQQSHHSLKKGHEVVSSSRKTFCMIFYVACSFYKIFLCKIPESTMYFKKSPMHAFMEHTKC